MLIGSTSDHPRQSWCSLSCEDWSELTCGDWAKLHCCCTCADCDIVFVIDTTGSMGGVLNALTNAFAAVIELLGDDAPPDHRCRWAVVEFKDQCDCPPFTVDHGNPGMRVGITLSTDIPAIQSALESLTANGGCDLPEANLKAILSVCEGWVSVLGGSTAVDGDGKLVRRRIVIYVSDAPGHDGLESTECCDYPGQCEIRYPTLTEATNCIAAEENCIQLFCLNFGTDAVYKGAHQASQMADATQGRVFEGSIDEETVADQICAALMSDRRPC